MENVVKNVFKISNFKNITVKNLCLWAFMLVFCGLFYSCNDNEQATNPNFEAITGKFLNKEGKPVAGIIVEATDKNGNVFSTDVTDANGFFKIQNMPDELTYGIVSFVDANADGIIHQEKLENVVNTCNNASGKVGNIFQGGDNDCEAVFKLTIKDAETKLLIQDAGVVLGTSQNATFKKITDNQGNVFFENIVPGKYTLTVTKTDYATYQENFLLLFPEGIDTLRWTVELTKRDTSNGGGGNNTDTNTNCCTNSVSFYFIDIATNEKIKIKDMVDAGIAGIRCINANGSIAKYPRIYEDGLIEFYDLCAERYLIQYHIPNYNPYADPNTGLAWQNIRFHVECGKNQVFEPCYLTKINAEFCCDNQIIVYVQDSITNQGIADATVRLWIKNTSSKELKTDARGRVIFDNVCGEGNYYVSVLGYAREFPPVTVTCKDTLFRYISISTQENCAGSIQITVADTSNYISSGFIAGAKIVLKNLNNDESIASIAITDKNGIVKFTNLPEGSYSVSIEDKKYFYPEQQFVIRLGCNMDYKGTLLVKEKE